jgi:hypothetical protein
VFVDVRECWDWNSKQKNCHEHADALVDVVQVCTLCVHIEVIDGTKKKVRTWIICRS